MKKCFKSYHVTCAVRNGQAIQMEHKGANVQLISHCDKHTIELNKSDDMRKRKTSMDMQIDAERLVLFLTLAFDSELKI